MTRSELFTLLSKSNTWSQDRYGNFKIGDGSYRLKMQATTVRFEKRAIIGGKNEWLNIRSDYYKYCLLVVAADTGTTYINLKGAKIKV